MWDKTKAKLLKIKAVAVNSLSYFLLFTAFALIDLFFFPEHLAWICDSLPYTCPAYSTDVIRNFIFSFGGLGALYGLIIAAKRQEKFSQQIDQGQDQLFNDRLGRGIEMLGHKDSSIHSAGIRILEDLANSSSQKNQKIIANLIYDFLNKTASKRNNSNYLPVDQRKDTELAIHALIRLQNTYGLFQILNFENLDLRKFDFADLIFEKNTVTFSNCNLDEAKFIRIKHKPTKTLNLNLFNRTNLNNTIWDCCDLQYMRAESCTLENAYFTFCHFQNAQFLKCSFIGKTTYLNCNFSKTFFYACNLSGENRFELCDLSDAGFRICDLTDVDFYSLKNGFIQAFEKCVISHVVISADDLIGRHKNNSAKFEQTKMNVQEVINEGYYEENSEPKYTEARGEGEIALTSTNKEHAFIWKGSGDSRYRYLVATEVPIPSFPWEK